MKTLDPLVYALASYFLDDCAGVTEAKRIDLAERIQQTIDDYGQELLDEDAAAYDNHIDRLIHEGK